MASHTDNQSVDTFTVAPARTDLVVMKFGGTSVGSVERIRAVAKRVIAFKKRTGLKVVVVVSAMSGETNRLIELAKSVAGSGIADRELNQLITSGEQVSSALAAMAFLQEGQQAISLLAHQVKISTDFVYGLHLIRAVETERIEELLAKDIVPIVAGFQGVDDDQSFTTLGRGGSDTTAVALAAALGRCRCYIYTDVDGVYTTLPSICSAARKLQALSYDEMLELAGSGAKVLQTRSVSLASKFQVPLVVCSSFDDSEGTEIVEEYAGMEDAVVSGIAYKTNQARITLLDIPDRPGTAAQIFKVVAEAGIVVDEIVQSDSLAETPHLSFTVPQEDAEKVKSLLTDFFNANMPSGKIDVETKMAKVAVVGEGMRTHAGVAAKVFDILGREKINIGLITTSEVKITVVITQADAEKAVRALHREFIESKTSPVSEAVNF